MAAVELQRRSTGIFIIKCNRFCAVRGYACLPEGHGICRIRKIRKKLGIRCKQTKKFKATTDSKHALPVAENILEQKFKADALNKIWVSDITYIPTNEGWLYCAAHKDLFNGEIVGYALPKTSLSDLF